MWKLLDRLISFIFSLVMLVVSVVLILVGSKAIEPQMVVDLISKYALNKSIVEMNGLFNPVLIAGVALLILSLKTTVFLSLFKVRNKAPIIVKTRNGEIKITQDTIVNTAKAATMTFDNVRDVQADMLKKRNGVVIFENIQVYSNSNIRELTDAIQEEVKETIASTTGVKVLHVNINVKNVITSKKDNSSPKQVVYVPKNSPTEAEVFNVDEAVKKAEEIEAIEEAKEESKEVLEEPIEEDKEPVAEVEENEAGDSEVSEKEDSK